MKLQDKETLSIADTVSNVLEGKTPLKEMDPKDHVSEKGDKFVVKNVKGDVVKEFETKEEAEEFAAANHDDLMAESPEEPRAKGEKEFKAKHVIKKTGENENGGIVKEEAEEIVEASITTMTDFDEYPIEKQAKKFRLKLKKMPGKGDNMFGPDKMTLTGSEKDIVAYFVAYMGADKKDKLKDLEQEFGEQNEWVQVAKDALELAEKSEPKEEELSPKQKKYQDFFNKALKKFGVDSPAELEGDKKKEFFDYVDKNYEADEEEDEMEPVKEATITISTAEINKLTSMSERKTTVDVDWIGSPKETKAAEKKFKVKIKVNNRQGTADITGDHKLIVSLLTDPDTYGWDKEDVIDVWPQLKA